MVEPLKANTFQSILVNFIQVFIVVNEGLVPAGNAAILPDSIVIALGDCCSNNVNICNSLALCFPSASNEELT